MKHKRTAMRLAVLLVLVGLLAGCGHREVIVGLVENHVPGHWEAHYKTFTGAKVDSVRAGAGQTLTLTYDVQADKGTLSITVANPENEVLWDVSLHERGKDTARLSLERDGSYIISIKGDDAGGSFDVSWDPQ